MRGVYFRAALGALFLFITGCGGGSPEPKSASDSRAAAAPGRQAVEQRPRLTAVETPPDVVAVMRLRTPATLTDTLGTWANLTVDWRDLMREVMGEVDQVVMLDAPLEASAMLEPGTSGMPRLMFAFSIGLSSREAARQFLRDKGRAVEPSDDGTYRIDFDGGHCLIDWAVGPAPARLVCSDKERTLEQMGPYMTRGLPGQALSDSEFFLRLDAEPWRVRFGKQTRMIKLGVPFVLKELEFDHPELDAVMSDTLYAVADELIALSQDLDSVTLEAKLDPRSAKLLWRLSCKLQGQTSWFGRRLQEIQPQMAAPPQLFWDLPVSSSGASYQVVAKGPAAEEMEQGLTRLVDAGLRYLGPPARVRGDLVKALEDSFRDAGTTVDANGVAADKATQGTGYTLVISEDKGSTARLLEKFLAVFNHPNTRKAVEARTGPIEHWPSVSSRAPGAGAGMPTSTTVYQLSLGDDSWLASILGKLGGAAGDSKQDAHDVYAVVHSGQGKSWLVISRDEQLAYRELSRALAPAAGQKLADSKPLQSLRQQKALTAGFSSLQSLLSELKDAFPDVQGQVTHLEHRGNTPLFHKVLIAQGGKEVAFELELPKAFFADLAGLVMALAADDDGALMLQ